MVSLVTRAAAAAALPCLLIALPPRSAHAYELQTTADGDPVRWLEDEVVFTLELDGRDVDMRRDDAEEVAQNALATWSAAGGPVLIGKAQQKGHGHDDDDGDDDGARGPVIRFATDRDDPDLHADSLARTRLSYDPATGRAQNVTITVNALDYRWSMGEPCHGAYDLEATLAHEIGHALGFRHSEDPMATMFTQPQPCERDRRDLAADDLAGIAALYGDAPALAALDAESPMAGCSASGSTPLTEATTAALVLAFALLLRRRSRTARPAAVQPRR